MKIRIRLVTIAVAAALAAPALAAVSAESASPAARPAVALVNGKPVSVEEFDRALAVAVRNKFYHRTPPDGQMDEVRREVADLLVDRALVLAEAERRQVAIDRDEIERTLAGYDERYAGSAQWKATREALLPKLRDELAAQQRMAKLEAGVRDVPEPSEAALRAFYESNPALFTEPERVHVSVILLKVDPAAPKSERDQAREEGRELHRRLAAGADFAELAKIRSADASAANGGDLGYLHRGMLGEPLHLAIDGLKDGQVSEAVDVLEGVAVFKLHERTAPRLRELDSVRARALDLLKRERSDGAWKDFVARLRRDAVIEMGAPWSAADAARGP